MKKILVGTISFIIICFVIPIIFTNRQNEQTVHNINEINNIEENNEPYAYSNYGTVRLLHNETGEVENLAMDEYLYRSCIS